MLDKIIAFSIRNKFIVFFLVFILVAFGFYAVSHLSVGAVPDITNNQVQVITVSKNLSTPDIEQFITYPVELEMSNLPGVKEIRSVSKFGLSVVTIVFEESMGTYLPRQLISEKLSAVREKIPEGFGTPEMGPITTGLGEIYQYTLEVKPGYKDKYSLMDLRTIQDWIVKRYLSGIPGVVEINTWGGLLKQYEVALNTSRLQSLNITAEDVFRALERNNQNAGGAYIEKVNRAYFIRGEGLMNSLDDIRNTVITVRNGVPVKIKDVARVGYGHAPRFGAITGNGEGEKVMGQVMMLKGANSKEVIDAVHKRVEEVSKSLPEGVYINPFLDRSTLIAKTTFTIYENLILGSLIVIFVVVLLLGNWRSGLIVASVIPLSLLFTLSMMYLLDIDANLMSLGAIDFGIIIDGAVIIVEFTAFMMAKKYAELVHMKKSELQQQKNRIAGLAASKMMSSAIFGQLIILIVFIPILTLQGVEGKMFRPMALTFGFALIGAMLLGLTYVPAVSALFLKPYKLSPKNISARIMRFLEKVYQPSIAWALRHRKTVLVSATAIFLGAVSIFKHLGAEFVPTLDEGDFVIQPVLKTGTSLSEVIRITTQIEKILKKFPETEQVVSRIGAAEIPTDPMSMEDADIVVTLKPKSEWKTVRTKDELAEKFKEALSVIPNVEWEFTQPIEMRFNELISGVRSDIAVKIYGEDMEVLNREAFRIKKAIEDIPGVADISVEKTAGLPQMLVKYDRDKLARYGLDIAGLNEMIQMAFAGKKVGNVFEGEKRFDLVVRADKRQRQDMNDLKNLFVDTPSGKKIPLSEVAEIVYTKGAAKISRDNTHRRVVVSINVRNRDLQSTVDDIRRTIEQHIKLPPGYSVVYGGQFENLQSAKKRLYVAVPIALILIFILLYMAFRSVREVLIIYTAIPFATVGGILLLWLRGMPFSISAGIGFIALFGIAVLNGIVLIERYKELRREKGHLDTDEIMLGAKSRLRAVILTASAAALGFLPMAVSTGAGAEVQKPLATVVIGGLITSTLLTLIVLPVLFSIFGNPDKKIRLGNIKSLMLTGFLFIAVSGFSQEKSFPIPEELKSLEASMIRNNPELQAARWNLKKSGMLVKSSLQWEPATVFFESEKDRITENAGILQVAGISQEFEMPWVSLTRYRQRKAVLTAEEYAYQKTLLHYRKKLYQSYQDYQTALRKLHVYERLDSLYQSFSRAAQRKFELGESNYLEKITAESRSKQWHLKVQKLKSEVEKYRREIGRLTGSDKPVDLKEIPPEECNYLPEFPQNHPLLSRYEYLKKASSLRLKSAKRSLWPRVEVEYSLGQNTFYPGNYTRWQVGLKWPLVFIGRRAEIRAARYEVKAAEEQKKAVDIGLKSRYNQLLLQWETGKKNWEYYKNEGKILAETILQTAEKSYKQGEIDFFQYIQSLETASDMLSDYWDALNRYNRVCLELKFLSL